MLGARSPRLQISDRTAERETSRARDTRAGTAGHRLHLAIERRSVALGGEVVAAHAPELAEAYTRWRARSGM